MSLTAMSSSSNSSSSVSIEKFPANGRETNDFRDWLFKAEAVLLSRKMLDVVNAPVLGLPLKKGGKDVVPASCNTDAKKNARNNQISLSEKAYSLIVNSLLPKQIEMVRDVFQGNAHEVMNVLKRAYGIHLSTASVMATFAALNVIKKSSKESMNDYFARIARLVHDCGSLGMEISAIQQKYFIGAGLANDKDWKQTITVMSQINASKTWSVTEMQQYLIEQENAKNVLNEKPAMQEETALQVHSRRGGYRGRGGSFRGGYRPAAQNVNDSDAYSRSHESSFNRGNYRGNSNFRGNGRGNFRGRYDNNRYQHNNYNNQQQQQHQQQHQHQQHQQQHQKQHQQH